MCSCVCGCVVVHTAETAIARNRTFGIGHVNAPTTYAHSGCLRPECAFINLVSTGVSPSLLHACCLFLVSSSIHSGVALPKLLKLTFRSAAVGLGNSWKESAAALTIRNSWKESAAMISRLGGFAANLFVDFCA